MSKIKEAALSKYPVDTVKFEHLDGSINDMGINVHSLYRDAFIAGANFIIDEFFAGRFRSILEEDKRFNDMLIKRSVANDLHIIAGNPSWFFNKYKDIKKENDK